jgi:hypothetical protein
MSMDRDELILRVAYAMHSSAAHSSFWTVDDMRVMANAAIAAIEASGHCIVDRAKFNAVLDTAMIDYDATPADRAAIEEIRAMIAAGRV